MKQMFAGLITLSFVLLIIMSLIFYTSVAQGNAPVTSDNCTFTGTVAGHDYYFCEGLEGAPDFLANDVGFTQVP